MIRHLGLALALFGCIVFVGCGSTGGARVYPRRGYYDVGYGPGPYWGWGGTVVVDRPIIIDSGPPVAVPLPEIPDMGMPDFGGDFGGDFDF